MSSRFFCVSLHNKCGYRFSGYAFRKRLYMDVKDISINDFDYPLPDERIAKFPLKERDASRLLLYRHGEVSHDVFRSLPNYIDKGALMIFNNTRVIRARLHFHKTSGALIEVFLLEPFAPADYEQMFQTQHQCEWLCMIGNLKKWKEGTLESRFSLNGREVRLTATRLEAIGTSHRVRFEWAYADDESHSEGIDLSTIIETAGELPIPPYLNRATEKSDLTTYQTVYSKIKGSVAAPTAGLHFTDRVLTELREHGVETDELTLHVGAGTFKPVKSSHMGGHDMHTEHFAVTRKTIERLIAHHGEAIAVGTTSVRTLESLYYLGLKIDAESSSEEDLFVDQWEPYSDENQGCTVPAVDSLQRLLSYMEHNNLQTLHAATRIIIMPTYQFKIVRKLITNFHQPKSTLLLLVSAFVGGNWRKIYDYALANDFRFLSYGDSSLLIP